MPEIYQTLGADKVLRPLCRYEVIKFIDVESSATEVHEGLYSVLLGLAFFVVVMMVTMTLVVMVVLVVAVMLVRVFFFRLVVIYILKMAHPCCRRGRGLIVEEIGLDNLIKRHIGIITLYDASLGLKCPDNGTHTVGLLGRDFGDFVKQYNIAKFNLLNHKILYIVFFKSGPFQIFAAAKLRSHTQGVDHGNDTVDTRHPATCVLLAHVGNGAYGLGYGLGLAYAAGFYHYVVEFTCFDDFRQLLHEVHFQRAAYAAVLQGHKVAVVFSTYHSAFLYKRGIYVNLAYIIDNHCEAYASFIGEYMVEKRSLATAEIAREQQHRYVFFCHDSYLKVYVMRAVALSGASSS